MLKLDINWIHVAVVAVANFMLGWAWFSPLMFLNPWMRGLGKDPKRKPSKQDMANMPRLMAGAALSAFAMSFGTAVLVASTGAADAVAGLTLGAFAGLTLVAAHALGTAFEGRKLVVIAISAAHGVAVMVVDGAIHGGWH